MQPSSVLAGALALVLTACQSYVNSPKVAAARAQSAKAFSDPLIARAYQAKPAMRFPARIGLAPAEGHAKQQLRNLDGAGKLEAVKAMPNVAAVVSIPSLLMTSGEEKDFSNKPDLVLRATAAKLHTDAIFLLEVETHVTDGKLFAPLTMATLGLFPNNRAEVIATALAALVDTRTGYVYGTLERSAGRACLTISWDEYTRDRTIERASRDAMQKLFGDVPDFWRGVVQAHR